jgi:acetyl-CoA acetyltransferase family protein
MFGAVVVGRLIEQFASPRGSRAHGYAINLLDNELETLIDFEGEVAGPGPYFDCEQRSASAERPLTAGRGLSIRVGYDGAAALVVMSDTKAEELGLTPLARIVSTAVTGLSPEIMGLGPVEAIPAALKNAGLSLGDIDLFEINEAFAVQSLGSAQQLGIPLDKLNVNGGAIAVGHPFGMTGARITATLMNSLQWHDKQLGVESMCVGGGMGMAMVIERLS